MARVISIANHKSGVGKTCSACNIGAGLARKGKKVLLIDFDPQANLSISVGINDAERNIYELIQKKLNPEYTIHSPTPNLDIIPSHLDLAGAEIEFSSIFEKEFILKKALKPFLSEYDYIIIDCPPSLGILTINAFAASNEVFVPIQTEFLSLQGLEKLMSVVSDIQNTINKDLRISGILITQNDKRKSINQQVTKKLEEFYKDTVFSTKIRYNSFLAEAPKKGQDIFRYRPKSQAADDYDHLCEEILKMVNSMERR